METITIKQVEEVFKYLDDFLDMMIGLDETPEELIADKDEYIRLKKLVSEETRVVLYSRLFINFVKYVQYGSR